MVAFLARVSNPEATEQDPYDRLIRYLIRNKHWSPFEMVNICVEVECSRDVGRQIIRHKSFNFQEFSGRYAAYEGLYEPREARLQDVKNRQNSLFVPSSDPVAVWWWKASYQVIGLCEYVYKEALKRGIAKEVARAILPEGLTPSKMYINGTLRSWIHYFQVRCTPETQKEHRELAEKLRDLIMENFPNVRKALENV